MTKITKIENLENLLIKTKIVQRSFKYFLITIAVEAQAIVAKSTNMSLELQPFFPQKVKHIFLPPCNIFESILWEYSNQLMSEIFLCCNNIQYIQKYFS